MDLHVQRCRSFFSEIYKNCLFGSQGAPFNGTSFLVYFGQGHQGFFNSIWVETEVAVLYQKWCAWLPKNPLVEVASSVLQVPGTWRQVMWSNGVEKKQTFFESLLQWVKNRNFWGVQNSFGFVVAIIKFWTISLVSLIWDPFQRTCRERPKSCTAFFSPKNWVEKC